MDQETQEQEEAQTLVDKNFPLFSKRLKPRSKTSEPSQNPDDSPNLPPQKPQIEKFSNPNSHLNPAATTNSAAFSELGLAEWAIQTCKELRFRGPTPVQTHCIPKILAGRDVLGIAQTGSGKTAAFALPILHRLAEDPYGVFALVITPTRELATQLSEQFKALGSCLHLRCAVVVGGFDMIRQAKSLSSRPHVVVATPGRLKVLLQENPDIPPVFERTKFLVLDEADRVLDVGFEEELRVIFQCLPKNRQTLLFSATMTSNLQTLLELSANKAYFYEAYEGFKTVETLKQQYVFIPKTVKDVYLIHILSKMEDMNIRSAMIFVSRCRDCHLLSLLLEELDVETAALHSLKSQALRLSALHHFKSGQVSILIATDVASRGLDIPTVDLVINYDLPRYPRDYIHRVGRTARAGRGGLAVSFVTENDVQLVHEIEAELGKQLEEFECKEKEVLSDFTKVCKAKRVAAMKMMDDGFEEKVKERRKQKLKTLAEKGLLRKKDRKRKRVKSSKSSDNL
ncbi:hypothetical protein SLA2020_066610 [Shorea laevis]